MTFSIFMHLHTHGLRRGRISRRDLYWNRNYQLERQEKRESESRHVEFCFLYRTKRSPFSAEICRSSTIPQIRPRLTSPLEFGENRSKSNLKFA